MTASGQHAMFPGADHDEEARQHFVRALKVHIAGDIAPGNDLVYRQRAAPAFEKAHGRPPASRKEVRDALAPEPHNQMWGALLRTSQEMLYDTVGPSIERQLPDLIDRARTRFHGRLGSLRIDPDLPMPRYHTAVDIHCKPGGYHTERTADDLYAGAEYDRTLHIYFMGAAGPYNDDMGVSSGRWLKGRFPDLQPRRILDMGCTIGHSTLPYADHFPEAELHAIDVAAPCLRYAHARAEALGKAAHFSQQNAERTDFADGSFDLVMSHIMMHETSVRAIRNIFRECHRLLRPGGVMLHVDGIGKRSAFDKYFAEWNAHNNNEPYLGTIQDEDFRDIAVKAGFAADGYFEDDIPSAYMPRKDAGEGRSFGQYHVVGARR